MKALNSLAYFVGYYKRRSLKVLKIISLMFITYLLFYAAIRMSGASVEIKKAEVVLWTTS